MSSKNKWKDKSTRDLKEELDRKSDERQKILEKIYQKKGGQIKKRKYDFFYKGSLDSLNPEGTLIIEESGPLQGSMDLYLCYGKGKTPNFVTILEGSETNELGVTKFLEEEVNPVGVHDHESGIRHRVWKLTGREVEIVKELWGYPKLLGERYRNGGWEEVKKTVDGLKKASEDSIVFIASEGGDSLSDFGLASGAEKEKFQDIVSRWERILNQRSTSRGDSHA